MVCRRLGFPEHKGTPKSLYQLYVNTRNEVAKKSAEEADKNYRALLEEEEAIVGWNQDEKPLIEESASMLRTDTLVEQGGNPFDKLSREEEDRVIQRLGESLSEILSKKYDCKITTTYTRKEDT